MELSLYLLQGKLLLLRKPVLEVQHLLACAVLRMMYSEDILLAESFLIQLTCRLCCVKLVCTPTKGTDGQ